MIIEVSFRHFGRVRRGEESVKVEEENREATGTDTAELSEEVVLSQPEYLTLDMIESAGFPYEDWSYLQLDERVYANNGSDIWCVSASYMGDKGITEETDYELTDNGIIHINHRGEDKTETYWVVVQMPKNPGLGWSRDLFVQANTLATFGYALRYSIYIILLVALAATIAFFVFLVNAAGHRRDTEKMFWEFRRHGQNLNSISSGMSRAVDERMKSERFKTELITNVSHDIKTPLTSIINYVDLLEKEDLKNEKACKYLEVLERQSARIKKLLED